MPEHLPKEHHERISKYIHQFLPLCSKALDIGREFNASELTVCDGEILVVIRKATKEEQETYVAEKETL